MNSSGGKTKSDMLLLLAAAIWGFAFVAQRVGMDYVGPFTFSAVRFSLGSLVLLPFLFFRKERAFNRLLPAKKERKKIILLQLLLGLLVFGGVSFQQYGLVYTTAGNAGFITGLYVVFVPVIGLILGQRNHFTIWIGVVLALTGLYFLSVKEGFSINFGDYLVLVCALIWSIHVLVVGFVAPKTDPIRTAIIQFSICAFLSWIVAIGFEEIRLQPILDALWPILYGGVMSVGIGYTLQVFAQQKAHPAYASIILSLESVFAVFGGWLILNEAVTGKILLGCCLMLAGMIVVQVKGFTKYD
ncbi:MAG: DMT family transporter [Bacteroidia bacterium]|nr:DMT family transporter [Bacteroidia bacterium]